MTKIHKAIAWCQIIGGAAGIVMLPEVVHQNISGLGVLFYIGWVIAFGLSIVAGLLLVMGRVTGARLSVLVQALQLIHISAWTSELRYVSGPLLALGISDTGGIGLTYGFEAIFWIGPATREDIVYLAINIFALAALWYLLARPIPRSASASTSEFDGPTAVTDLQRNDLGGNSEDR